MSDVPTGQQHVALAFVAEHLRLQGCPPTLREIGEHMSIRSTNGVDEHLRRLERKGYLVRRERLSRSLQLTDKGREYLAAQTKETTTT